jgi:hypothetical protein
MNICQPNFSQNITMTKTGLVRVKLGNFINVDANFDIKSSSLYTVYEFKIGG